MTKYYLNTPCTILHEMDNEVLIKLDTHAVEFYENEFSEYGPSSTTELASSHIIVSKKYITDNIIVPSEDVKKHLDEFDRKKRELEANLNNAKSEAIRSIAKQKGEAQKEIEALKKKASDYQGLEMMFDYLSGELKYAVYTDMNYSWRFGIIELDNAKTDERYESDRELVAVSFRSQKMKNQRKTDTQMYIHDYSDGSGSKYKIEGFRTKEEALERLFKVIEDKKESNIDQRIIDECDKIGIVHPKIEAAKVKNLEAIRERKLKDLEEAKNKVKALEAGVSLACAQYAPQMPHMPPSVSR